MKINFKHILFSICLLTGCIVLLAESAVAKPQDSLRVKTVIKSMQSLTILVQDSILPVMKGDEGKKIKSLNGEFKKMLKESESMFKDTMQTNFTKLSDEEKKRLMDLDQKVQQIKSALPEQSTAYHHVMMAYMPLYRALQEMRKDGKLPLLATYLVPYNVNTTDNGQVTMIGAYLNFYLEYRIKVGDIEIGPDIVDPERLVFTFPQKLLEGKTDPFYVEVKAAPKKQVVTNGFPKVEDNPEQHAFLLVIPNTKK